MHPPRAFSLCLFVLIAAATLPAQQYDLLADLNEVGERDDGSDPRDFALLNGTMLFTATSSTHGRELWASGGSFASTRLVRDVQPGRIGSEPEQLTPFGAFVYFVADDGVHGRELWRSDGSAQGTSLVVDLSPGLAPSSITSICAAAGRLFFVAGTSVFVSDGTATGTSSLQDLQQPPRFFASEAFRLVPAPGGVYFFADDGTHGYEPWYSDGTRSGTRLAADVVPGPGTSLPGSPNRLVRLDSGMAWAFPAPSQPWQELYYVDAAKQQLLDLGTPLTKSMSVSLMKFYVAGGRLWIEGGPDTLIAEAVAGSVRRLQSQLHGQVRHLTAAFELGARTLLFAQDAQGVPQIWESDGTQPGTKVAFALPSPLAQGSELIEPRVTATRFYFTVVQPRPSHELWVSDGTAQGSFACRNGGAPMFRFSKPASFEAAVLGDSLVLAYADPRGREPWITDGTSERTTILANIMGPTGIGSGDPRHVNEHAGLLFFAANDYVHGAELWRTDGTELGTALVADIRPGHEGSAPRNLFSALGLLFFTADDGVHGNELWVSNGTAQGTRLVHDLYPGQDGYASTDFVEFDGLLFFRSATLELWVTDGTSAGTLPLSKVVSGASLSAYSVEYVRAGDQLYFLDTQTGQPTRLFALAAGSRTLKLLAWTPAVTASRLFGDLQGALLFQGSDGSQAHLYATRGTAQTPQILASGAFAQVYTHHGRAWLVRYAPGSQELLVSDGTPQGLVLVRTFANARLVGLRLGFGDRIAFEVTTIGKPALWVSDGTAAGTLQVGDCLSSRMVSSSADGFWFRGYGANASVVPWYSDGTVAGTYAIETRHAVPRVEDVDFGPPVSGRVVFVGKSPVRGSELFIQNVEAGRNSVGRGCGPDSPWLDTNTPRLGKTLTVEGGSAPAGHIGVLLLGSALTSMPLPGVDCRLYPYPYGLVLQYPFAVTQPHWQIRFQVPNEVRLTWNRFGVQTVYLGPTLELQATAGVVMQFGI